MLVSHTKDMGEAQKQNPEEVKQKNATNMIPFVWHSGRGKTTGTENGPVVLRCWERGGNWPQKDRGEPRGWRKWSVSRWHAAVCICQNRQASLHTDKGWISLYRNYTLITVTFKKAKKWKISLKSCSEKHTMTGLCFKCPFIILVTQRLIPPCGHLFYYCLEILFIFITSFLHVQVLSPQPDGKFLGNRNYVVSWLLYPQSIQITAGHIIYKKGSVIVCWLPVKSS